MVPRGIQISSRGLTRVINPEDFGKRGAGHINRREATPAVQKPMAPCGIPISSCDLARVIDPKSLDLHRSARYINRRNAAPVVQKPMIGRIVIASHDLARVTDPPGLGNRATRVNGGKGITV